MIVKLYKQLDNKNGESGDQNSMMQQLKVMNEQMVYFIAELSEILEKRETKVENVFFFHIF